MNSCHILVVLLSRAVLFNRAVHHRTVAAIFIVLLMTSAITRAETNKGTPHRNQAPVTNSKRLDIRALTFKEVEVGVTTLFDLNKAWGAPASRIKEEGVTILVYHLAPFKSVEVTIDDGLVASVVIYLKQRMSSKELTKQLNLDSSTSVTIRDEAGKPLGQVFPERGVLFGFHPMAKGNIVGQILLEQIAAESFVLRAKQDKDHQYQRSFADLDYALNLEPGNAEAYRLKAKLLLKLGKYYDAEHLVDRAIELEPDTPDFRLIRAQAAIAVGEFEQARKDVDRVLDQKDVPEHLQAKAFLLAADLVLAVPDPDYEQSLMYHQQAIETANPLVADENPAIRQAAKQVLVQAHLSVGKDIAFGEWKNKKEVVPRWLDRAAAIAEEMITHDDGDPLWRLIVSQQALAALVGIRDDVNPTQIAQSTIVRADSLDAESTDPVYKQELSWILGKALVDVLRIEHSRGQTESARKYGQHAITLLESAGSHRQQSGDHTLLLGEAYFRMGSIFAVLIKDHKTAINWYNKSFELLKKPRPVTNYSNTVEMGEWFVSMGVSYWENRDRERAIQVTEHGVQLIEQAVELVSTLPEDSLEIPYSNLSHMYEQIGDDVQAQKYADRRAEVGGGETTTR